MDNAIKQLGEQIETLVKSRLGDTYAGLTPEGKALLAAVSQDAAELQIKSMLAVGDAAAQLKLQTEKRQIDAQIANLRGGVAANISTAFWGVVGLVARAGVSIALAAV